MALLDLIWTTQQFALIWMTTGGGPLNATEMLSTFTYKLAFSQYEFSVASASRRDRPAAVDGAGLLLRPPAEGEGLSHAGHRATDARRSARAKHRRRSSGSRHGRAASPALPVLWMLSSSFKTNREIFEFPPRLITENFSFDAYTTILTDPVKMRFFINSYVVALSVTALTLFVAILAAYAFSRLRVPVQATDQRGRSSASRRCRRSRCSSRTSGSWSRSALQHLSGPDPHLHGVHAALRDHHDDRRTSTRCPRSSTRPSRCDGAGPLTALWRILVPISVPGLVSVGVYTFMICVERIPVRADADAHRRHAHGADRHPAADGPALVRVERDDGDEHPRVASRCSFSSSSSSATSSAA